MALQLLMWDDTNKRFKRSVSPAPDYRAGSQTIQNGQSSVSVSFSTALSSTGYSVICTWMNTTDTYPQFQPVNITAFSTAGFTASWNVPTDSANYVLNWHAIANG